MQVRAGVGNNAGLFFFDNCGVIEGAEYMYSRYTCTYIHT